MSGVAAAIFDVDGTLVRGGTERLFFRHLVLTGRLSPGRAWHFLLRLAAAPRKPAPQQNLPGGDGGRYPGVPGPPLLQAANPPRLRPGALSRLRAHQAKQHKIILLTGSLAFLMHPLKEFLGADWLIATELARRHHLLTGQIAGIHPRGQNKRLLLEELARNHGLDLSRSFAYGDHEEDIPVLECVGHPVAVNPTRLLKREARRRGWPVEYF